MFNASPNAYVLIDPDLVIVGCNDAYLAAVSRADRDEIVGRYVFDAFPSDPAQPNYQLLKASFERVIATQAPDVIALIPYDTSGPGEPPRMRYWSATHTPVFDAEGTFRYILQHTVDVTELRQFRRRSQIADMSAAGVLRRAAAVQAANDELSSEIELVHSLFRQAPGFMAVVAGPDHVFQLANAAYERVVGRTDLIGRSVADAIPEVVDQGFVDILDRVVQTGKPFVGRGVRVRLAPHPEAEPEDRYLDFIYQPFRDASGKVAGVLVQGHDITEQKKAEQDLQRQTELLQLAQDAGGFGTFEWDYAKGTLTASRTFRRLYGFEDDDTPIPVALFSERVHPEDRDKIATSPGKPLEEALRYTEYRIGREHAFRWVARQGTVIRDAEGRPARIVGAVHDITRRKRSEDRLQTLAHESAHRVKNLLAIVQAIVSQTLRRTDDVTAAAETIRQRLVAIGTTQTALIGDGPPASDLATLVQSAMELHGAAAGRISVQGPNVLLDPDTALGLTLVLHELGTNAMKYGALSVDAGHVDIRWHVDAAGRIADFTWQERRGPPVMPPSRKGFGSTLIQRSLPPVDGATTTIDFDPEGVTFRTRLAVISGLE